MIVAVYRHKELSDDTAEQRREGADVEERQRGSRPDVNTENTVCESVVYTCRPETLLPETLFNRRPQRRSS